VVLLLMRVLRQNPSLLQCARGLLGQLLLLLLQQQQTPSLLLLRKQAAAERRVLRHLTSHLGRETNTCWALWFANFLQVGLT
jgi:hypothetical protein